MPITRRSLFARAAAAFAAGLLGPVRRLFADDGGDLVVHEWGVLICRSGGLAGEGVDVASSFPPFVYSRRADHRRFMAAYQTALDTPIEIDKPVVHFYGPEGKRVRFRTRFAEGLPLVWWPRAEWDETSLAWDVTLGAEPAVPVQAVERGHWFERLRATDSMYCQLGDQSERFLYYDGESRYASPLGVRKAEGAYRVENTGREPALDVYLCARAGEFVAWRSRLDPGESWVPAEPLGEDPVAHLAARLGEAGLTGAESSGLAEIWKDDFFAAERLVLVHRLADGVYDRLLPAEVEPRPATFVRVGLALVADQDPDLAEAVEALLADLSADDYEARTRAEAELSRIGRPALAALARAEEGSRDAHVRHRARVIRLGIEGRAGGDAVSPELKAIYEEWKRTGRVDPYAVQGWGR